MNLKKIIALALVVCMVLSFFPVSVFAEEWDEEIVLTDEEYYEEPQEEYVEEIIEEEPADYVEYVEPVEEIVVEEPAEEPVVEEPAEEPALVEELPAEQLVEAPAPAEQTTAASMTDDLQTAETFDRVKQDGDVAHVGEFYFATLQEAITFAQTNVADEVDVIADVSTDADITIANNGANKITIKGEGNVFRIAANVIIEGKVEFANLTFAKQVTLQNAAAELVTAANANVTFKNSPSVLVRSGKLSIAGGTFEGEVQVETGYVGNTVIGNVTGGTFFKIDKVLLADGATTPDYDSAAPTCSGAVTVGNYAGMIYDNGLRVYFTASSYLFNAIKKGAKYENSRNIYLLRDMGGAVTIDPDDFVDGNGTKSVTISIYNFYKDDTGAEQEYTIKLKTPDDCYKVAKVVDDGTTPKHTEVTVTQVDNAVCRNDAIKIDDVTDNGMPYASVNDAIVAASAGQTIKLLKDINADLATVTATNNGVFNIDKNITIDGNGNTITAIGTTSLNVHVFNVLSPATIKNVTIVGNGNNKMGIHAYGFGGDTGVLTLENVTTTNNKGYGVCANGAVVAATNLTTSDNGWGGVNVDHQSVNKTAGFTLNGGTVQSLVVENGLDGSDAPITASIEAGTVGSIIIQGKKENIELIEVTKSAAVTVEPPTGYYWDGSTTLQRYLVVTFMNEPGTATYTDLKELVKPNGKATKPAEGTVQVPEGYSLAWVTVPNCKYDKITEYTFDFENTAITADTILYGRQFRNTHTYTYNFGELGWKDPTHTPAIVEGKVTGTAMYNDALPVILATGTDLNIPDGHHFNGWTWKDDKGVEHNSLTEGDIWPTKLPNYNFVATASEEANAITVKITRDDNATGTIADKTFAYGDHTTLPDPATGFVEGDGFTAKPGYTFKEYKYVYQGQETGSYATGTDISTATTVQNATITFKAKYDANAYKITYLDGKGETLNEYTFHTGEQVKGIKDFRPQNYDNKLFTGTWTYVLNGETKTTTDGLFPPAEDGKWYMPAQDVTFTPVFTSAKVLLNDKGDHPHYFDTVQEAIDYMEVPGQTTWFDLTTPIQVLAEGNYTGEINAKGKQIAFKLADGANLTMGPQVAPATNTSFTVNDFYAGLASEQPEDGTVIYEGLGYAAQVEVRTYTLNPDGTRGDYSSLFTPYISAAQATTVGFTGNSRTTDAIVTYFGEPAEDISFPNDPASFIYVGNTASGYYLNEDMFETPEGYRASYTGTGAPTGSQKFLLFTAWNVTFNTNGTQTDPTDPATIGAQFVFDGFTATEPTLTRVGYILDGWYKTGETVPFNFTTPITEDTALEARWSAANVTLTFEYNGTTETVSGDYGDPLTDADVAKINTFKNTRSYGDGKKFDHWVNAQGTTVDQPTVFPKTAATFTAVAGPKTYDITFNIGNGTAPQGYTYPNTYTNQTQAVIPNPIPPANHVFVNWSFTLDGEDKGTRDSVSITPGMTGTRVYTANYELNEYTVTFNKNIEGATVDPSTTTVHYGHGILETSAPVVTPPNGMGLVGWYTKDGTGDEWGDEFTFGTTPVEGYNSESSDGTLVEQNVTVYGKYDYTVYDVTFTLTDGQHAGTAPEGYTYPTTYKTIDDKVIPAPIAPTGYTFDGWALTINGAAITGLRNDVNLKGLTGTRTYVAQYTANNYTVTFNSNYTGITPVTQTQTLAYDATITTEPTVTIPATAGVKLDGWYTKDGTSGEWGDKWTFGTSGTHVTGNTQLYGKWTEETYSIQYRVAGVAAIDPASDYYPDETYTASEIAETPHQLKPIPEIAGHTLDSVTVSFDGASPINVTSEFQAAGGASIPAGVSMANRVYTFTFSAGSFTLRLLDSDGAQKFTQQVPVGTSLPAVSESDYHTNYEKAGYTFDVWVYNQGEVGTTEYTKEEYEQLTMPATNTDLKAKLKANEYTITLTNIPAYVTEITGFKKNTTTGNWERKYTTDQLPIEIGNPNIPGVTFTGWIPANQNAAAVLPYTIQNPGNVTLEANYTQIAYTSTYWDGFDNRFVQIKAVTPVHYNDPIYSADPDLVYDAVKNRHPGEAKLFADDMWANEDGVAYAATATVEGNGDYYLNWYPLYNVTFKDETGVYTLGTISGVTTKDKLLARTPTVDPQPGKQLFWEKEDGSIATDDDYVTGNNVLKAHWISDENVLTVTFEPENGQEATTVTVIKGNRVEKPVNPTRTDFIVFNTWLTEDEEEFDFTQPVEKSITLHADWQLNSQIIEAYFGRNASLQENINLNAKLALTDATLQNVQIDQFFATYEVDGAIYTCDPFVVDPYNEMPAGRTGTVFTTATADFASFEMWKPITIRFFFHDDGGDFLIKEYANVMYDGEEIPFSLKAFFLTQYSKNVMPDLMAAVLDYGANAQIYFKDRHETGYHSDADKANLVNYKLNPNNVITATQPENRSAKVVDMANVDKVGAALALDGDIKMDIKIMPKAGSNFDPTKLNVSVPIGYKFKVATTAVDGIYSVQVYGIKSNMLGNEMTVNISQTGVTGAIKYTYSPFDYASKNWNNSNVVLAKLCQAIVAYGTAASEAFN